MKKIRRPKVLVVDDEQKILRFIKANLVASNYEVVTAASGQEALEVFEREDPELVLLDVMLPDMDGFDVCRYMREGSHTPIIMVTAKGDPHDAVRGLDAGADDYIAKPFDVQELLARVRAVLRRMSTLNSRGPAPVLHHGKIKLNIAEHRVEVGGREVRLTPTEFRLLAIFLAHAGKVLTHEYLLTQVWGAEYRDDTHYLRVAVARLRQKLKQDTAEPDCIITIPMVGYKLE